MKKIVCLILILTSTTVWGQKNLTLENDYLSRTLKATKTGLQTEQIINKQTGVTLTPVSCNEFSIRISQGTNREGTDKFLTAKDFKVKKSDTYALANEINGIVYTLENKKEGIEVKVHYELPLNKPYLRKYLTITSDKAITIERIDIESMRLEDVYQPYIHNAITAQAPSNWRTGLGQPIYSHNSGTFWGVEFPAASNSVSNQHMQLGYLWGNELAANETYTTYKSIMGTVDEPRYLDEAFYDYIDDIRIRPLRLQIQYNSWFDLGQRVDKEKLHESIKDIHNELVEKRGVAPLNVYAIDDGWQDLTLPKLDEPAGVWTINKKFSADFKETHQLLDNINSSLGLWLSPGCFFGAKPTIKIYKEHGYESLSLSMSMSGPKYMDKLERRILELTEQGVTYFKYDGLFGHLNIRDFELNGRGAPAMPQLKANSFGANDKRLNNTKYDELKTYYLVAGTERLMQLMLNQHAVNPNVYTAITNGAFLSPWWLQYSDAVWLINSNDAAKDATRTGELTYRDGIYHEVVAVENTKFPIHSIFNHEPKKVKTGEDAKTFRDYLFMHLSRGAGFVELYIKTKVLSDSDWDVMAEGLKWVKEIFPTFKHAVMFGGDPRKSEVYGYSGWNNGQGYISIHNPSSKETTITLPLDRDIGVKKDVQNYSISSPLEGNTAGLKATWSCNDVLSIKLQSKEIRVLTFNK